MCLLRAENSTLLAARVQLAGDVQKLTAEVTDVRKKLTANAKKLAITYKAKLKRGKSSV